MPSLNVLIQNGEVCQCLRTKTMFYQVDDRSAGSDEHHVSDTEGPFWCAHTQSLIGPDGQMASDERCRPGRGCCETA